MLGRNELLKSVGIAMIALVLLAYGSFSWFNFRTPSALTIGIENPTSNITVERFNETTEQYELVESTDNEFLINIPHITFYEWLGSLVSTFGENLQYRIKITGNFRADDFEVKPIFNVNSSLSVATGVAVLQDIKVLKSEYRVSTPTESISLFQNAFPQDGFLNLFPTDIPIATAEPAGTALPEIIYENELLFPNNDFFFEVEEITIAGQDRFQMIFYLRITPDSDAVSSIMSLLTGAGGVPEVDNTLKMGFGFRSVPFYAPTTAP
ncbi:MAG: hypothetical protein FWE47_01895 [Oscillospiraceae bacterium]|nr:hypothetical protein [Oscillospiraceae bacterium]